MANTATTKTKVELAENAHPSSAERTTRTAGQGAKDWGDPAAVLIGAFIIGVALAKVARHA
jgi:hypothetical protein